MNSTVKTVVFWLVIVVSAVLLWTVVKQGSSGQKDSEVNFSQFMASVDQGNVKEVTIIGMEVRGKLQNDNSLFHTTARQLSRHDQDASRKGRVTSPRHQQRQLDLAAIEPGPAGFARGTLVLHDPPDANWWK